LVLFVFEKNATGRDGHFAAYQRRQVRMSRSGSVTNCTMTVSGKSRLIYSYVVNLDSDKLFINSV